MSYTSIEGKQQGAVCRLWLNRPEVRSVGADAKLTRRADFD